MATARAAAALGGGGYGGWSENALREDVDGVGGHVYGDAALRTIHFSMYHASRPRCP